MKNIFYKNIFLVISLTILLVGRSVSYADPDPAVTSLSLKQAIELAVKNNTDLLLAKSKAKEAQGQQAYIDADLLPQIGIAGYQQRTWNENLGALGFPNAGTIGPFNTFDVRVRVSQRILDLAALSHSEAGKIKSQAAQINTTLVHEQVILATSLAYIEALRYREELLTSAEDVRLAEHLLSVSEHQQAAGLASFIDVARARTQLAREKSGREQLNFNAVKAIMELKRIIKIPLAQSVELVDNLTDIQSSSLSVEDAIAQAEDNRIEKQLSRAEIKYSLEELKAAKRDRLPKVDAVGEWGKTGNTPQENLETGSQAALQFSLPIWEGGRIAGKIKEQTGLNEEENIKLNELNVRIEEDVRLALEALKSGYAEVESTRNFKDLAEQELTIAQDRFGAGVGDNTDVISAQTKLADARDSYVHALAQYDHAQLNYYAALGKAGQFDLAKDVKGESK